MSPSVGELLEAFPEFDEDGGGADQLHSVIQSLSNRPVPVGSFRRLWSMGGLQAKIGVAYFLYWVRGSFQDADERQRILAETRLKAAVKLLSTMAYLRGAVMKLGQLVASFPDIVPHEFVDTLSRLHFEAPPMHFALLREHMRDELGSDAEDVFKSFDKKAFAAASLGQVHRARLKTGESVAIKIQYPGISRTICSDFRNLHAALSPFRLSKDWDNLCEQLAEVKRSLEIETDYEAEARSMRECRDLFDEDDGIVVPRVYERYSTRRILTMEYLDGMTPDQFLAGNPSQELRDDFGSKIHRAIIRPFKRLRMVYADPHPGNFLYMEDGRLGFVDFGAIRRLDDIEWMFSQQVLQSAFGSYEDKLETVRQCCMFSHAEMETKRDYVMAIIETCDFLCESFVQDGPFDFGDESYVRRGFDTYKRAMGFREVRQNPVNWLLHRGKLELLGLLYRLAARVDVRGINDEEDNSQTSVFEPD